MIVRPPIRRRGGATTVEVAVVMSVFLLFLFGIFEYCRFILMFHTTTNASRDAARYAVVNMIKPENFDVRAFQDSSGRVFPSITEYAQRQMSGTDKMIVSPSPTNYYASGGGISGSSQARIEVFPCDPDQLNQDVPVIAPKPVYSGWNDATFGERIAVRISGNYRPVLPSFLMMGNVMPVTVVVTMGSEG